AEGGPRGPRSRTLSIYYLLLHEFDPFVGRPQEQAHLARGFTPIEHRVEHAQHSGAYIGVFDGTRSRATSRRTGFAAQRRCDASRFTIDFSAPSYIRSRRLLISSTDTTASAVYLATTTTPRNWCFSTSTSSPLVSSPSLVGGPRVRRESASATGPPLRRTF